MGFTVKCHKRFWEQFCPIAASLVRGLLFRVRLDLVRHLDAGDEIEIAQRTQRASLAFALISRGSGGRCPERVKLLLCGFLVMLTFGGALSRGRMRPLRVGRSRLA